MFSAAIINQSGGVQRELQLFGELVEVCYLEGDRRLNLRQPNSMAEAPVPAVNHTSRVFVGIHADVRGSPVLTPKSFFRENIGIIVKPVEREIILMPSSGWFRIIVPTRVDLIESSVHVKFNGDNTLKLQSCQNGEMFDWIQRCIREPPPQPSIDHVVEAIADDIRQGARRRIQNRASGSRSCSRQRQLNQ